MSEMIRAETLDSIKKIIAVGNHGGHVLVNNKVFDIDTCFTRDLRQLVSSYESLQDEYSRFIDNAGKRITDLGAQLKAQPKPTAKTQKRESYYD
jgi:hypothetical protein